MLHMVLIVSKNVRHNESLGSSQVEISSFRSEVGHALLMCYVPYEAIIIRNSLKISLKPPLIRIPVCFGLEPNHFRGQSIMESYFFYCVVLLYVKSLTAEM